MTAGALLRWQFGRAHALLDTTFAEAGAAGSAGACYARAALSEDVGVNGVLAGTAPLALTVWAGRTGVSGVALFPPRADWPGWARRARIEVPALRRYALAVHAATDRYLATLADDALDPDSAETPLCLLYALLADLTTRRADIAGPHVHSRFMFGT